MNSTQTRFPCGDITLEGVWHLPRMASPLPCVIVCHPHPLYGSNMSDKVVMTICRTLSDRNIAAFRFNFRGVGRSEGSFGGGAAEQEDIRAALSFVLSSPDIDASRTGLAGYSFGAGVALPVALQDERVSRLALVSPALSDAAWEQLRKYRRPKLIIIGDADSIIPLERFRERNQEILEPGQYRIIPGADHFWWGYVEVVAEKVAVFFADGFRWVN